MNLGNRIKLLREERNITQKELATKLNIGNTTLSQYENGQRVPSDEIKILLADYFDVSIDYLLGRTDIKKPYEPETIAAHHEGDEWTEDEIKDIEKFKEFVRLQREKKGK